MMCSLIFLYIVSLPFIRTENIHTPCDVIGTNKVLGKIDRTAYQLFQDSEYSRTCTIQMFNINDTNENDAKYEMIMYGGLKNGTIRVVGKLQDDMPAVMVLTKNDIDHKDKFFLIINKTSVTIQMKTKIPYIDIIKCETKEVFSVNFLIKVNGLFARINNGCVMKAPLPPDGSLDGEFLIRFIGPTIYNYMDYGYLLPYSNWDKTNYDEINIWIREIRVNNQSKILINHEFANGAALLALFLQNRQVLLFTYHNDNRTNEPEISGLCDEMGRDRSIMIKTQFMEKGDYPVKLSINGEICAEYNQTLDLHHLKRVTILAEGDPYNITYIRGILYSSSLSVDDKLNKNGASSNSNLDKERKQWHLGMDEINFSDPLLITTIIAVAIIVVLI